MRPALLSLFIIGLLLACGPATPEPDSPGDEPAPPTQDSGAESEPTSPQPEPAPSDASEELEELGLDSEELEELGLPEGIATESPCAAFCVRNSGDIAAVIPKEELECLESCQSCMDTCTRENMARAVAADVIESDYAQDCGVIPIVPAPDM